MAFEHYIYTGSKRLRCGYTTGSCAAIAAKAATEMLLDQHIVKHASIVTPKGIEVSVDVECASFGFDWAICGVRKDGGDDHDATHGALISVEVKRSDIEGITIDGGKGVGRVTRPGLSQPIGTAAINPVPRSMIAQAVEDVCQERGVKCAFEVIVSVEGGEEIAKKTFNSNLGIVDGISILGTSGIVEPRSLKALRDSIELEFSQYAAEGVRALVLVPGNMGRDFLHTSPTLTDISDAPSVECANFIGDSIDYAVREGFTHLLVIGHLGKMSKVAGGIMDTHSRIADCRTEIICAHAAACGASQDVARELLGCITADACCDVLDREGLLEATLNSLSEALQIYLDRRADGKLKIGAVVFTPSRSELIRTSGAALAIEGIMRQKGKEDE